LREINYYNGVKRFIKYTLSNPKILVDAVLNFHVKGVKIKVSRSRCYYDTSSRKKKCLKKYLCWFAHVESYVLYKIMV
jgi:hypothetical protein